MSQPLFPLASKWLTPSPSSLLVTHDFDNWLLWLRKAQSANQPLLAALIHNQLGFMMAEVGDHKTALVHFEAAMSGFDNESHDSTEGEVSVKCLEAMSALGCTESAQLLTSKREWLLSTPYAKSRVAETIVRNMGAIRIRLAAPKGVELFFQAIDAYKSREKESATELFEAAAKDFVDNLHNRWYRWPVAVALHEAVVTDIFAKGYGVEEHVTLLACLKLVDSCEVPSPVLREKIRSNLELTGLSVK